MRTYLSLNCEVIRNWINKFVWLKERLLSVVGNMEEGDTEPSAYNRALHVCWWYEGRRWLQPKDQWVEPHHSRCPPKWRGHLPVCHLHQTSKDLWHQVERQESVTLSLTIINSTYWLWWSFDANVLNHFMTFTGGHLSSDVWGDGVWNTTGHLAHVTIPSSCLFCFHVQFCTSHI